MHVAVLWGNPETVPVAVMVEFPGEYREPWYSHSSTYHAVRVEANKQNAIASLSHSISRRASQGCRSVGWARIHTHHPLVASGEAAFIGNFDEDGKIVE